MTLAKTCYASNMMPIAICNHESFLNRDVSMFQNPTKSDICSIYFCCKFRQLYFCQILFRPKLVSFHIVIM